jgi:hypothetical protein
LLAKKKKFGLAFGLRSNVAPARSRGIIAENCMAYNAPGGVNPNCFFFEYEAKLYYSLYISFFVEDIPTKKMKTLSLKCSLKFRN